MEKTTKQFFISCIYSYENDDRLVPAIGNQIIEITDTDPNILADITATIQEGLSESGIEARNLMILSINRLF
jgi:hypothetical protein